MIYIEQHRELQRSVAKFVESEIDPHAEEWEDCLLYTSPSPRDGLLSRMPSSA